MSIARRFSPFSVQSFGLTDRGIVRDQNEDAWAQLPECNFYILTDGMGGSSGGEVAAHMAIEELCHYVLTKMSTFDGKGGVTEVAAALKQGIRDVNRRIYRKGSEVSALSGMGTTLCCLYFWQQHCIYAHVGDSRIYRLRQGVLEQLTQDDSLLEELLQVGVLELNEAEEFPLKHVLTKALGNHPEVDPTVQISTLQNEDLYLLCSDGLSSTLSHAELSKFLTRPLSLNDKANYLIEAVKQKGGSDNITVLLLSVRG